MSTKRGLGTQMDAAARAVQEQAQADRAAELRQMDLLDPLTPEEMAEAREACGSGAGKLAVLAVARERRRGRPPGALNRSSEDLARYLLQFGPDPLVGAMILQGTPTEVLMELSGKSYLECLDRQIRCRELTAPYIHSKRPVAVDMSIHSDFNLIEEIVEGGGPAPEDGEFLEIEGPRVGDEEAA